MKNKLAACGTEIEQYFSKNAGRQIVACSEKKMIEIARALSQDPSLLILDEPTASLTNAEKNILFGIINVLKAKGVALIYISHRMDEIKEISDKVSILKDGCYQGTFNISDISTAQIINRMVGREMLKQAYVSHKTDQVVMEISELSGIGYHQISFRLHKGEIIGLAGLVGSGRTELALGIFGDTLSHSGRMFINGVAYHPGHPSVAVKNKIAYIPDDRLSLGLFMEKSISENIASANLSKRWFNSRKNELVSEEFQEKLGIRTASPRQKVYKLSGGNQQKVVMAKWLAIDPEILIINEPTHGVDVAAKAEIYRQLRKLSATGKSILLISSELSELFLLSDRIAVMYNGTVRAILDNKDASEELVTRIATGM